MKRYVQVSILRSSLWVAILLVVTIAGAFAQTTPGLIIRPSVGTGQQILDPNRDGFVSISRTGFTNGRDEGVGNSEIPYRQFPALTSEPTGDLNTGTAGGHTDLAGPATPITSPSTGSPVAVYFDGANLMFRLRLGGTSTASKGYSVLIDSNNLFEGTGANPGFEFEVLLASNSAVQVLDHRGTTSGTIFTGAVDQYSQRAVAGSTNGGNPDYFYDFFVPISAFGGAITADTPLRMSGITITSAQSGFTGTISDVGGVNFQAYGYNAPDAWRALLGIFPPTTLTQVRNSGITPAASAAPVVNGPINANSTSISGTSTEIAGSVVTVLLNGEAICGSAGQLACPTVSANGTWTLSGIPSTLLVTGNIITARVTAPGKTISPLSNAVTVTTGVCTETPAPRITGLTSSGNDRYLTFIPSITGRQRITIYSTSGTTTSSNTVILDLVAGTAYPNSTLTPIPSNFFLTSPGTSYAITTTPVNVSNNATGCESPRSNLLCREQGNNATVNTQVIIITGVTYDGATFTSNFTNVPTNLTSLTVSISGGTATGNLVLYRNGTATTITTPLNGAASQTLSVAGITPALTSGDILSVRSVLSSSACPSASAPSNFVTVRPTLTAPVINAPSCGFVTTLSGTSTNPIGTTIQFYTGGTAGTRTGTLVTQSDGTTPVTATVTSTGAWVADFTSTTAGGIAAGTAITARAVSPNNVSSVNSNVVTATPGPEGVLTVNPITAGATTITGTAPASAAGGQITLYIEGTPFPTPVFISGTTWGVEGISAQDLFAGATVTATFTPPNGCESRQSAPVVVACSPPPTAFTLSPTTATVCGGNTTSFELSGSEYGIIYRLLVNGEESGSSVLGTGGPITLISGPFTNLTSANQNQTVTYRARSLTGIACDAISTNSVTVTVLPQPVTTGLTLTPITPQPVCGSRSVSYSLAGSNPAYVYQLVNQSTGLPIGSPVPGSTGNITLNTGPITANTTIGLRVSFPGEGACGVTIPDQATVFISGPSVNNFVFAENNKVCVGNGTIISVQTEFNANTTYTYRIYRRVGSEINFSADQLIGTPFNGTGGVVSRQTPGLPEGNQFFYATVTSPSCGEIVLANTVTVQVTNAALQANAGPDQTVCGSSVVLSANDVGQDAGLWSQVSGPTTAVFSPASSNNATVSNLSPGTYILRWTSTPVCGAGGAATFDEVTITVNCDAYYTINPPKYNNEYIVGDLLAFATDPDGDITGAAIVFGSLPDGLALANNGNISVTNPAALGEGAFPLTIRVTDQFGGSIDLSIVIRLLGNEPIIIPLPVELVYFTATVRNNQAHLEWLTASELDNDRFEIERSLDARSFEKVGTVKGKGTTSLETKYQFTDRTPVQGTVYYRLKQVDTDGQFAYSNVIAVNAKGLARELATQAYPNPFQDVIKVTLTAPEAQTAVMTIYDMNGRRVMNKELQLDAGLNRMELNLEQLQSGMYILKVVGAGMESTTRIMKN
ncbi:T9SS type A sorting domain-containing protein [Pontibacter ramchanderi]|uniref:Putative secreted protein (Por secretion system target) n=1 Tax=Pontibacter ramchanderi TaxID=1179743 RepID=A0A2N3U8C2_9BACT|nr:T9SS type A sorting domain-containing protein [Pontibacter ramchanderi]PKV62986.1 putative secreted protein (Por secretion system target) [Pontibacter ramchanderi]